jgi:hypothetical protein
MVGYWNWELGPGTACRAFVKFDLGSLPSKKIVAASLRWSDSTQRAEGTVAANYPPCSKWLFIANEPWTKFDISGDQITGEYPSGPVEVGSVVRQWNSGQRVNEGFFFVGSEEKIQQQNADYCLTIMKNLRLEVTNSVPKNP